MGGALRYDTLLLQLYRDLVDLRLKSTEPYMPHPTQMMRMPVAVHTSQILENYGHTRISKLSAVSARAPTAVVA